MNAFAIFFFLGLATFFVILLVRYILLRKSPPSPRIDDSDDELYYHPVNVSDSKLLNKNVKVVQLFLSCTNLANKDFLSHSDPVVEVFQRESSAEPWKKVGETEVIYNDLNPFFCTPIVIGFFPYLNQQIKFSVKDIDFTAGDKTFSFDHIGDAESSLRDIIENRTFDSTLLDRKGKDGVGEIHVIAEEVPFQEEGRKSVIHFNEVSVKGLPMGLASFLQIFRVQNGRKILVYNSEVQQSTYNPRWKTFTIRERQTTGTLLISIWKWNAYSLGTATLIGEVNLTFEEIYSRNGGKLQVDITKKDRPIGTMTIICQLDKRPIEDFKKVPRRGTYTLYLNRFSFQEYIHHGLEIHTMCALDMTTTSEPYHQVKAGAQHSVMEQILHNFVTILGPLDQDQKFPFYGYGARESNAAVQPFFAFNGNIDEPDVVGVDELIKCYRSRLNHYTHDSLAQLERGTPRDPKDKDRNANYNKNDFRQLIKLTIEEVHMTRQKGTHAHKYYILFIVVAGDDINVSETIGQIIEAAELPISIILVALGEQSQFPNLTSLDADDVPLSRGNRKAIRDVVQVVHINPKDLANKDLSPNVLSMEVLGEIPAQVCSYMALKSILPTSL